MCITAQRQLRRPACMRPYLAWKAQNGWSMGLYRVLPVLPAACGAATAERARRGSEPAVRAQALATAAAVVAGLGDADRAAPAVQVPSPAAPDHKVFSCHMEPVGQHAAVSRPRLGVADRAAPAAQADALRGALRAARDGADAAASAAAARVVRAVADAGGAALWAAGGAGFEEALRACCGALADPARAVGDAWGEALGALASAGTSAAATEAVRARLQCLLSMKGTVRLRALGDAAGMRRVGRARAVQPGAMRWTSSGSAAALRLGAPTRAAPGAGSCARLPPQVQQLQLRAGAGAAGARAGAQARAQGRAGAAAGGRGRRVPGRALRGGRRGGPAARAARAGAGLAHLRRERGGAAHRGARAGLPGTDSTGAQCDRADTRQSMRGRW